MFPEVLSALSVCSTWQRNKTSKTHGSLELSWLLKGWRLNRLSSSLSLSNKREHTQAGLDSHLKTLYSFILVLLFSLNFSQCKAWPTGSLWFICLQGCLCQIGNISKHLELRCSDMDVIMTVHGTAMQMSQIWVNLIKPGRCCQWQPAV